MNDEQKDEGKKEETHLKKEITPDDPEYIYPGITGEPPSDEPSDETPTIEPTIPPETSETPSPHILEPTKPTETRGIQPPPEETPPPKAPCDPATMTCDEMRDKIVNELVPEKIKYESSIEKLDEVKTHFPSEDIDRAYNEVLGRKKQVDDDIYNIFEKFTICATKPEPTPEELEKVETPASESINKDIEKTDETNSTTIEKKETKKETEETLT